MSGIGLTLASTANASNFNTGMALFELISGSSSSDGLAQIIIATFIDGAAYLANHKIAIGVAVGVIAASERIKAIDAVDKPKFEQKIQGTIDGGRFDFRVMLAHFFEQIIGFHGAVTLPNKAKNLFSIGGQANMMGAACLVRRR